MMPQKMAIRWMAATRVSREVQPYRLDDDADVTKRTPRVVRKQARISVSQRQVAKCLTTGRDHSLSLRAFTGLGHQSGKDLEKHHPSLQLTLNHFVLIDHFHPAGLEDADADTVIFGHKIPCPAMQTLTPAQQDLDQRLIAFCMRHRA
ncbi:MAG: hypothetical protein AB1586_03890 [Pseudomonadota bacterium]|jgi:hypothetical protein